jgi:monothiol glutaredoxin
LYVNGEFIGGCDIITQMHESGELKEVLAEVKETSAEESSD